MKKTLLALAIATVGTMFAAQAPQSAPPAQAPASPEATQPAPAKTKKAKKHAKAKKHHAKKGTTETTTPPAVQK